MKEFNASGELAIKPESITSPESPVSKQYVDDTVEAVSVRSPRVLIPTGTGIPSLADFPDAQAGDVIERISDGSKWRVDA